LPQNQFTSDMCINRNNTIPFFATSKCAIEFIGKFNTKDERETDMMSSRWFTIPFKKQIINPQRFKPCPKCFAELVMSGALCDLDWIVYVHISRSYFFNENFLLTVVLLLLFL